MKRAVTLAVLLSACGTEQDAYEHLQRHGFTAIKMSPSPYPTNATCVGSRYGFLATNEYGHQTAGNVCCGPRSCEVHRLP